jgi:hypothetical protein
MYSASSVANPDKQWGESIQLEARTLSNEILSDIDQLAIKDLLDEARDDLFSLDTEIARLQAMHDHLLERRLQSVGRIERLKVGIAPQKKVPPELLSRIFVSCTGVFGVVPVRNKGILPLWTIVQVCSRWRDIATAEPLLWNRLDFNWGDLLLPPLIDLAHDVLSCRGGQGIVTLEANPSSEDEWETILHLISTYPSRLRNLKVTGGGALPKSFSTPLELFDHIESLDITIGQQSNNSPYSSPMKAFSVARSLRTAMISTLRGNALSTWPIALLLPWSQLTSLVINGMPFPILSLVFSRCVHLITCEVNDGWSSPPSQVANGTGPIIMNDLQSLSINQGSPEHFRNFISCLVLPRLKALGLYTWLGGWPHDEILNLISRSACALETFKTNFSVPEEQIVRLMEAMPGLTCFETYNTEHTILDSTLDTIVMEGLCPKLRILWGWKVISIRSFWEFLRRRGEFFHSNSYEGIQEVMLWMERKDLIRDTEYLAEILPEFKRNGKCFIVDSVIDLI